MNVHLPSIQFTSMPVIATALAAVLVLGSGSSAQAAPYIFDSVATIDLSGQAGGVYYYDLDLQSLEKEYYELYIVLDPEKVVHGATGTTGPDLQFLSATLLSHPDVDLYFSDDRRGFANMNNPRLLNQNEMDTYDPALTDPLPDGTMSLSVRFGVNRQLGPGEMYQIGYWVGDLRGMIDPNHEFTESDGNPIPEPATLLLALGGLAGLYGARRKR